MPDLARPFVRDHARADGVFGNALAIEKAAVARIADAGHDLAADALPRERGRRVVPQRRKIDGEALARVDVRELVTKPQIAVRHVRDAAPAAAGHLKHAPQLLLCSEISFRAHAAR